MPGDSVASGTITIEAGGTTETGTIRLLARGLNQTVEQVRTPTFAKTVTYSRGLAKYEEGENTKEASLELSVSSQSSAFPLALIAATLVDPESAFEYLGLEDIADSKAHRIRFWKTFASQPKLQHLGEFSSREIWIEATSALPVRFSYEERDSTGPADRLRHDITYSDYRNVGGTLYPFRTEKCLNGTTWATIQIDRVTLHNGLSDTDFVVR